MKGKQEFEFSFKGVDEYLLISIGAIVFFAVILIGLWFSPPIPIDTTGINYTNDGRALIPVSAAFTMVNGVATVVSIIVGFSITLSTLIFHELPKDDAYTKRAFYEGLAFFVLPLLYLAFPYAMLIWGQFEIAIKTSESAIFFALLVFIVTWLINGRRLKAARWRTC